MGYTAGQTKFSQAPEHTYDIGIQHDATLGNGGSLVARFDYSYVSQYWRAADPRLRVAWYASEGGGIPAGFSDESGDFGQFNARLTYSPGDGNWGYDFATVGRPREYGSTLTFRF